MTSFATRVINEALVELGLEAEFPADLKFVLIRVIDTSKKLGYSEGYTDCQNNKPPRFEGVR